jgi:DNA-binding response OmpR family regulator
MSQVCYCRLKLARLSGSNPDRKDMPIVLLSSAKLDDQTKALAKRAGVVEYALKDADLSELVSRLTAVE